MTPRHQTHLGSTGTKCLTIVDFAPPSSLACNGPSSSKEKSTAEQSHILLNIPTTKTFLFQLPDELLMLIVELAASETGIRPRMQHTTICNNGMILVLSKVCKRLKRVAQELLYRDIRVESPMVPPSVAVIKLHRTLRERTDLRQHCRYVIFFNVLRIHYNYQIFWTLLHRNG